MRQTFRTKFLIALATLALASFASAQAQEPTESKAMTDSPHRIRDPQPYGVGLLPIAHRTG